MDPSETNQKEFQSKTPIRSIQIPDPIWMDRPSQIWESSFNSAQSNIWYGII